jgi:hypothetical protein
MKAKLPILVVALVGALSAAALACNIPVFRYALEQWRADPYQVVVFHRGPLTPADLESIRPLEEEQDQQRGNLVLRTVDVEQFDEADDEALFAQLENASLPWMMAHYPPHLGVPTPIVSGPLSRDAVAVLIDSPVRQELIKRLAAGQTAVWLLLEGGDAEQNQSANVLLEEQLKKLKSELTLPELTDSPEDNLLTTTPLEIEFSVLSVSRDDPAEQAFVSMLMHSESDLAERSEPMVFPVFGRGRALFPLVGAGITPQNIHNSAAFLVGPCSCQVKDQNPGFDLLLAADWSQLLSISEEAAAEAAAPEEPVLVPIPSGSTRLPAPTGPVAIAVPTRTSYAPMLWIVGGLAVVGLLAMTVMVVAIKGR